MGGPGSGRKPREYPPEVVDLVCGMYRSGMTVAEIRLAAPKGYRIQTILERYLPARRPSAKRNQSGDSNHSWKGERATYGALHLRVEAARGKPSLCTQCGRTNGRFHWANLTGDYTDVNDYARMCPACHLAYDARRRATTGQLTMGRYAGLRRR